MGWEVNPEELSDLLANSDSESLGSELSFSFALGTLSVRESGQLISFLCHLKDHRHLHIG